MSVERRNHNRLVLQSNAFAALGSDYCRVGKIKNLSHGGLAFEYIAGEQDGRISSRVDIFLPGKIFRLYNVPCRVVYDIEVHVPHVINPYYKMLTTKQCGIKFEGINDSDLLNLKLFIEPDTPKFAMQYKHKRL